MKRVAKKVKQKSWGSFDREKGRKAALKALGSLRRIKGQMAADRKVSELSVYQLTYHLNALEETISQVLPAPDSISQAKLTGLWEEDDEAAAPAT
jgi:hypothetical protein